MPIFFKQAYEAVCNGNVPSKLTSAHFADWKPLGEALDWLTPEQRCDAAYADWLLQLNTPARQALLQVRNLLIGQGALAANYLAELAQNADDASDGTEAHIRIVPDGEWLFVSNNGRKITAGNLLGLCRFFVHSAGEIVELNEKTIGRFGIGFKSSYRIASEVFVYTWDKSGSFSFRLPISRQEDLLSHPDQSRLKRLLDRLRKTGISEFDDELTDVRCLGYCTPEYMAQLPQDLATKTKSICKTERGTLFCFHLRADRRKEVAVRITGQAHEVYELCPLFLPNLRVVQVGPNELGISVAKKDAGNGAPNIVTAEKVTLVTQNLQKQNQSPSRARFWRLRGSNPQDRWQVALHADSQHRLRVELEDDESGATIKDGAAYAFFPLNAVNWPFRLHLHVDLPTNLARDNWNPDDKEQVEQQITRAVSGMAEWLEKHPDKQHSAWRIESLITRKPNPNETWAWLIWQKLVAECHSRRLLRTPWGSHVTAQQARTVRLVEREGARKAWEEFCAGLKGLTDEFPIVNASGVLDFGLAEMPEVELRRFLLKAVELATDDLAKRRLVMGLFLVTSANPSTLEAVAERLKVPFSDGSSTTLASLMKRPAGSDLPDEWHTIFKTLYLWLWEDPEHHGWTAMFDAQLRFQLRKLSERVINYTWAQIPISLAQESAWTAAGPNFWRFDREACPAGLRKTVILSLRGKDSGSEWRPLTDFWLAGNAVPHCFQPVLTSWRPGPNANYTAMRDTVDKLRAWGLWDAWEEAIEEKLRNKLVHALMTRLNGTGVSEHSFNQAFGSAYQHSKQSLPPRWQAVMQSIEEQVLKKFVILHADDLPGEALMSFDIPAATRSILLLNSEQKSAPSWLTPAAFRMIQAAGAFGNRTVSLMRKDDLDEAKKRQIANSLLQNFYKWSSRNFSSEELKALDEICSATPALLRGNWAIGITSRSTELLKDMVNPSASGVEPSDAASFNLNHLLLQHPNRKWIRIKELPEALRLVPTISEACVRPTEFSVQINMRGHPLPVLMEQVKEGTRADPIFKRMLQSCKGALMGIRSTLDIRWLRGGEPMAELTDAPFAVKDGRVVTNQIEALAGETQYTEILALYSRKGRGGEHFRRFQELWQKPDQNHAELYAEFRDEILSTLLQTEVLDLGYRPHHIARELLQNAESAYDSIDFNPAVTREFRLVTRHLGELATWETTAEHTGRHFNQQLRTGEQRDDIRLIVSIPSAEQPPTEGWVGRFNRGFKSIFTITETVRIISGPYAFSVQDLLLLSPAKPEPSKTAFSPQTRFVFQCPKIHVLRLYTLSKADGHQIPLPLFNCSSFIFLRNINHVHIQLLNWVWTWKIEPRNRWGRWSEVTITQTFPAGKESFLVHSSDMSVGTSNRKYRYGVALRLANSPAGVKPQPLENGSHKIRLTFETEDEFPLDFIVNGDFETDSGRLGIRNSSTNELLLVACLRAVRELCEAEADRLNDRDYWLAWAEVLHLSSGENDLAKRFENHHKQLVREFGTFAEFLCGHVPHNGQVRDAKELLFPTPLLRKLQTFVRSWGGQVSNWIDAKIEANLPKAYMEKRPKLSLPDLVSQLGLAPNVKAQIIRDIQTSAFHAAHGALDAVSSGELSRAKDLLIDRTPPEPVVVVENWTVADLWHWWERRGKPVADYTLEGPENWKLLYGTSLEDTEARRKQLGADLFDAGSKAGKRVWYKLFGIACLMSAGRRMSEVRGFWQRELESRSFWAATEPGFEDGTRGLFSQLASRKFDNQAASGEDAYFWRRVFYDIRKIHKLVWEDDFPVTLLELIRSGRGGSLLDFLKTGSLPGQQPWIGVFGQSAGSPLFFLVRELCRLGVITDPAVKPLAFFVSTPVRRAMERIGWLPGELSNRVDFISLARLAETLHTKLAADRQFGSRILEYYDMPLLHLGLEG